MDVDSEDVLEELYALLNKKNKGAKRKIIGVVGFVGSGKTHLAEELAVFLKERGINALSLNMDLYNSTTRAERNEVIASLEENHDPNWPRRAYPQNPKLIRKHLKNIRAGTSFSAENLCNPQTKNLDFSMNFKFDKNFTEVHIGKDSYKFKGDTLWVICDGVKLIKYRDLVDSIVFVKAENPTRFNRLLERNRKLLNPAKIRRDLFEDLEKNLILDYDLDEKNADIVIENNNFKKRKIIKK